MSVRPAQKVSVCNQPPGLLFVQDEICLDDGAGNISEAMRFRTLDPTTLATIGLRIVDMLTGVDAVGTPVTCPCRSTPDDDDLCAALAALPMSGSNPVSATLFVAADCQKYSLLQMQDVLAVGLRGEVQTDAFGTVIGYLLTV